MSKLVVDWAGLAENFDDDKFAMSLVVEAFLGSVDECMVNLRTAVVAKAGKPIAMAAHSLKGAMLNFGAEDAVKLAQKLENHGYGEDLPDVEGVVRDLEAAVQILVKELQSETNRYKEAG